MEGGNISDGLRDVSSPKSHVAEENTIGESPPPANNSVDRRTPSPTEESKESKKRGAETDAVRESDDSSVAVPTNRSGAEYSQPRGEDDPNAADEKDEACNYSVTHRWYFRAKKFHQLAHDIGIWATKTDTNDLLESIPLLPTNDDLLFDDAAPRTDSGNCDDIYEMVWGEEDGSLESLMKSLRAMKELQTGDLELMKERHAGDPELMKMVKMVINERAHRISERHKHVRTLLAAKGEKGNESGGVSALSSRSTLQLDPKRFKPSKQASPSAHNILSIRVSAQLDQSSGLAAAQHVRSSGPASVELLDTNRIVAELHQLAPEKEPIKELEEFQSFVEELMKKAKLVSSPGDDAPHDSLLIKNTVEAIMQYPDGSDSQEKEYGLPPLEGFETDADQPILYAIVLRILEILGDARVTQEQVMPNVVSNPARGRRIDFSVHEPQEHLAAIFPAMLQRAIEVKVVGENLKCFIKFQDKGYQQICGHQAKRLHYSFDFGGIGEDDSVFGVVLTMASIEVLELELKGVGTEKVELIQRSSKCLPLMKGVSAKHYGHVRECVVDDDKHASGFVVLAGALAMLQSTGERGCRDTCTSPSLGQPKFEYLGSGAFSHAVKTGVDEFMKIPKAAAMEKTLEEEAKILLLLAGETVREDIPRLCENEAKVSEVRLVLRKEVSTLHCLKMKGIVGEPVSNLLSRPSEVRRKALRSIVEQVYKALCFAHGRKVPVFHLDVRPGNVIILLDGQYKVMLSDWGCALEGKTRHKGFRGCPPYAHDDLLQKESWTPRKEHDFASLAYTLAHLYEGKLLWRDFAAKSSDTGKRLEIVKKKGREWFSELPDDMVREFEEATGLDLRRSQRQTGS